MMRDDIGAAVSRRTKTKDLEVTPKTLCWTEFVLILRFYEREIIGKIKINWR